MTDAPTGPPAKARGLFKVLKDALTEKNNATFDLKRILWAVGCVWFMGCESYAVAAKGQAFDPVSVATGLSGLLAAGGAALAMNRKNESDAPEGGEK